jgi:PKD repeat protein
LLGAKYRTLVESSADPGESFFRSGGSWHDLYDEDSTANFCIKGLSLLGVSFNSDVTYGNVPLDVYFEGSSELSVNTWDWDFGDGKTASGRTVNHTYELAGLFDVTLEIDAAGDIRSVTKPDYIIALADTLIPLSVQGEPNTTVELSVYARNNVPVYKLRIPVEYSGDINLDYDSFSTTGCRTEYFDYVKLANFDPVNKRMTFTLTNLSEDAPPLQPGSGTVMKIYFTIPASATPDQTALILMDGYLSFDPIFYNPAVNYNPIPMPGTVSLPFTCGDASGDQAINLLDITFLINYLYKGGPAPVPLLAGDPNGDFSVNILDVTCLINFLYKGGPAPLCP